MLKDFDLGNRPVSRDVEDAQPSGAGSGGHQMAFERGDAVKTSPICLSPVVNDSHQDGAVLSE